MSIPLSNSVVRSGLSEDAGFVPLVASPPMPPCVGNKPVPCAIPDSRLVEYTVDVRYGSGSLPAEPYATRSLPNCSQLGGERVFVNSHATLALGNQLR